jgi:hypothetical protein
MKGLPPLVKGFDGRSVVWERLEGIDYETMGYLLSCHLIIEHYMEEFLATQSQELDWRAAKLTFGQKAALLTKVAFPDAYDMVPPIKHLNGLRNKFGHKVTFKLTSEDLDPLAAYLRKVVKEPESIPTSAIDILHMFTSLVCVFLAGCISHYAMTTRRNDGHAGA